MIYFVGSSIKFNENSYDNLELFVGIFFLKYFRYGYRNGHGYIKFPSNSFYMLIVPALKKFEKFKFKSFKKFNFVRIKFNYFAMRMEMTSTNEMCFHEHS